MKKTSTTKEDTSSTASSIPASSSSGLDVRSEVTRCSLGVLFGILVGFALSKTVRTLSCVLGASLLTLVAANYAGVFPIDNWDWHGFFENISDVIVNVVKRIFFSMTVLAADSVMYPVFLLGTTLAGFLIGFGMA
jgi:uncharacterized membrane protein (Fun14 family)